MIALCKSKRTGKCRQFPMSMSHAVRQQRSSNRDQQANAVSNCKSPAADIWGCHRTAPEAGRGRRMDTLQAFPQRAYKQSRAHWTSKSGKRPPFMFMKQQLQRDRRRLSRFPTLARTSNRDMHFHVTEVVLSTWRMHSPWLWFWKTGLRGQGCVVWLESK